MINNKIRKKTQKKIKNKIIVSLKHKGIIIGNQCCLHKKMKVNNSSINSKRNNNKINSFKKKKNKNKIRKIKRKNKFRNRSKRNKIINKVEYLCSLHARQKMNLIKLTTVFKLDSITILR